MPAWRSQRGVGCTHVEKPPLVILYFFGPIFSIFSPKKYTTFSWTLVGAAIVPGRAACGCAFTVERPHAL